MLGVLGKISRESYQLHVTLPDDLHALEKAQFVDIKVPNVIPNFDFDLGSDTISTRLQGVYYASGCNLQLFMGYVSSLVSKVAF